MTCFRMGLVVVVTRSFFFVTLFTFLSACCMENACRIERKMKVMPDDKAFSYFKSLSAQDQVDVYVFELNVSRPVSSRYEFLLKQRSGEVVRPLINAAKSADSYMVMISILSTLDSMPRSSKNIVEMNEMKALIQRCKKLALNEHDDLCIQYEGSLVTDVRRNE
jgi:hypothetical protein